MPHPAIQQAMMNRRRRQQRRRPRRMGAFYVEDNPEPSGGQGGGGNDPGIQGSPVGGALGGLIGGGLGYGLGKLKSEYMSKEPTWGEIFTEGPGAWEDDSAEKGMLMGASLGAPAGSALMDMHQKGKLPSLQDLGLGDADEYDSGQQDTTQMDVGGGGRQQPQRASRQQIMQQLKTSSYKRGYEKVAKEACNLR